MSFKFKLQRLLDVKEKIEETKKNEFAEAKKNLNEAIKRKEDLILKRQNLLNEMKDVSDIGSYKYKIAEYNRYLVTLKNLQVRIERNIKILELELEKKRIELSEAVKNRKILEKMKEKDLEKYKKEELKIEEAIVNEIVTYNYSNKEE